MAVGIAASPSRFRAFPNQLQRPTRAVLILKRKAMGHLVGIGTIKRCAESATIDLSFWPNQLLDLFRIVIPSLQMPRAELPFGIFFVAGALPVLANLYLPQRRCGLFGYGCGRRSCLRAGRYFPRCIGGIAHWILISPPGIAGTLKSRTHPTSP